MNRNTQSNCHVISISMLKPLHEILDLYFGFVVIKCKFLYFAKFWNATMLETRRYGCCFGEFVAWSTGYGSGSDSALWLKNGIGFRWYWAWFAWMANWMGWKLHGIGYQCMGCQAHGLQSARAHTKCAGPRKMRGPTQSARTRAKCAGCVMSAVDAKCADAREMRGPRFNCAGRTECAGRNCAERWVGRTAHAPPPHLPFHAHAMQPRFYSRGPRWALRVKNVLICAIFTLMKTKLYSLHTFLPRSPYTNTNQLWS